MAFVELLQQAKQFAAVEVSRFVKVKFFKAFVKIKLNIFIRMPDIDRKLQLRGINGERLVL